MLTDDLDAHAAALERADCGGYDARLLHAAAAELRASADALEAAHTELAELRRRYIAEIKAGNAARRLAAALAGHLRRRTAERDALRLDIATLDKRDRESAETLAHLNTLRQQERDRVATLTVERDRLLARVAELRAGADVPTLPMGVARAATGWEGDDR